MSTRKKHITIEFAGLSGSGKATLLGRLLYAAGIDLSTLESMAKGGIVEYDKIAGHLSSKGRPLEFETQHGLWQVDTSIKNAHLMLYLIDASVACKDWKLVQDHIALTQAGIGPTTKKSIIAVVNKCDLVAWDAAVLQEIGGAARDSFQGVQESKLMILPISALSGKNVMPDVATDSEVENQSLLQVLDASISDLAPAT